MNWTGNPKANRVVIIFVLLVAVGIAVRSLLGHSHTPAFVTILGLIGVIALGILVYRKRGR